MDKAKINPNAVLDEEAQKRVYQLISRRLNELESLVDLLKLMKARANRRQLTAGDVMKVSNLAKEIL